MIKISKFLPNIKQNTFITGFQSFYFSDFRGDSHLKDKGKGNEKDYISKEESIKII
jgi:hypothetical protein